MRTQLPCLLCPWLSSSFFPPFLPRVAPSNEPTRPSFATSEWVCVWPRVGRLQRGRVSRAALLDSGAQQCCLSRFYPGVRPRVAPRRFTLLFLSTDCAPHLPCEAWGFFVLFAWGGQRAIFILLGISTFSIDDGSVSHVRIRWQNLPHKLTFRWVPYLESVCNTVGRWCRYRATAMR